MCVSPSLWKGEITAGQDFWVSEDHRILNVRDVFNKHSRCLAHNLVQIMRFSLHTAEICLHNICQQPEQLSRCWNNMKSAALPSSRCWHPRLSFALRHQGGVPRRGRGGGRRVGLVHALLGLQWMHKLLGAGSPISFLVSAPLSAFTHAGAWQDYWFLRTRTNQETCILWRIPPLPVLPSENLYLI